MTIIQNKKTEYKTNFLIPALILALILTAGGGVFFYNRVVNISHDLNNYKTALREIEVKNAELKNNFFEITNPQKLQSLIENGSLILDKNPEYIKKQQLVQNN